MSSIKLKYSRTKTELDFQPPFHPVVKTAPQPGWASPATLGAETRLREVSQAQGTGAVVTLRAGAPEMSLFLRCAGPLHEGWSPLSRLRCVSQFGSGERLEELQLVSVFLVPHTTLVTKR